MYPADFVALEADVAAVVSEVVCEVLHRLVHLVAVRAGVRQLSIAR